MADILINIQTTK